MRPIKRIIFCLIILSTFFSCANEKKSGHSSALPHEILNSESENLSKKDLENMATASGREVVALRESEFFQILNQKIEVPVVCFFVNAACESCFSKMKTIENLQAENQNSFLLKNIFLNDATASAEINKKIRTSGIASDCYQLQGSAEFFKKIDATWRGGVPAFLISYPKEEVHLFYPQDLSREEFLAVLQTLIF